MQLCSSMCVVVISLLHLVATNGISAGNSPPVCTMIGRVYSHREWYGFLVNKVFHQDGRMQYRIQYPVTECCASLLIYYDDQVKQLRPDMTCEERVKILPNNNNQVIQLKSGVDTTGCRLWNKTGQAFYDCEGERLFQSSVKRTWFFALSKCGSSGGPLNLNYVFNITGYYGECEEDPLAPSSGWNRYVGFLDNDPETSSSEDVYLYLSISLGIVAGLALIAAAVFFGLWFMAQRNATKSKGSSVTSSQATMTQDDIFYVNPSLSDQGTGQEYSQSGSENYYEVIPERRSYESINTGLANGTLHLRHVRGGHPAAIGHYPHHGHHPHHGHVAPPNKEVPAGALRNIHHPVFDNDYPPPPYQPPKLIGMGKHLAPGHAHTLSLPSQRGQRPPVVHHAYHSSLVPTSAALGHHPSGLSASASGGNLMGGASNSGANLGQGHMGMVSSGQGFNGNLSSMMTNPSSVQNYNINTTGGLENLVLTSTGPPNSSPSTLASFVGSTSGLTNPNMSAINLNPMMAKHERMGSNSHSMANNSHSMANNSHSMANNSHSTASMQQPSSSAAMSSMSQAMSAASHPMATTSGQSETVA